MYSLQAKNGGFLGFLPKDALSQKKHQKQNAPHKPTLSSTSNTHRGEQAGGQ